jgi:uncharacterized protein DUF5678
MTGDVGTLRDRTSSSDTREYVCDSCGHRIVKVNIAEQVVLSDPVTEWIANHSGELAQFEGKYVAIQDFLEDIRVIASGSYDQVMTIVENKYPGMEPVIMKIPTSEPPL